MSPATCALQGHCRGMPRLREVLEPLASLGQLKEVALLVTRLGFDAERQRRGFLSAGEVLRARMAGHAVVTLEII